MEQPVATEKQRIIERGHQLRDNLLKSIEQGDLEKTYDYIKEVDDLIQGDLLDLLKRNPGNRLRSYKNFLLSHNTLYGYAAGKGGLSAVQSHYMTEKYAVLIEHSESISRLEHLHQDMLQYYSNPKHRFKNRKEKSLVSKVESFIEQNFSEEISIEEIAEYLYVHPSHLMRTFKREKSMTVSHYRNQKRLAEAKHLLKYSHLPITEIAYMVGFKSSQYFSRVFKKEFAETPIEYRKRFE